MNNMRFLPALLLLATFPSHATAWSGKTVQYVQPDNAGQDCFYFTLNGVTEADPVRPGNAWFGVDRATHPGAKELFAVLLAAKLMGTPINVVTSGTLECGYAGVSYAWF